MKANLIYTNMLFLIILFACTNDSKGYKENTKNTNPDTLKIDIPLTKYGKPIYPYRVLAKEAEAIGLEDLKYGYDSIQIRIWRHLRSQAKEKVIIIKNVKSGKWEAEACSFRRKGSLDSNNITITDTSWKHLQPKSGWQLFSNAIFNLQITSLPDMDKINGYEIGADGDMFCIEVATKNYYRYYAYWEPGLFENEFWQAKNMVKIIELLDTEFNFK